MAAACTHLCKKWPMDERLLRGRTGLHRLCKALLIHRRPNLCQRALPHAHPPALARIRCSSERRVRSWLKREPMCWRSDASSPADSTLLPQCCWRMTKGCLDTRIWCLVTESQWADGRVSRGATGSHREPQGALQGANSGLWVVAGEPTTGTPGTISRLGLGSLDLWKCWNWTNLAEAWCYDAAATLQAGQAEASSITVHTHRASVCHPVPIGKAPVTLQFVGHY
jgi:hypothetical protein